jgi:hypothetical protein
MVTRWAFAVIGGCVALVLIILGLLTRGGGLDVPEALHAIKDVAPAARADYDSAWEDHLRIVDQALQEGSISAAVRAWHDAYGAALGSGGWEGMIAVGDAVIGIGTASGLPNGPHAKAREAYLTALTRARRDRSVDGVLRTAEAFAALGDRAVVLQCLRAAEDLGANDAAASHRVREFRNRWATGEDSPVLAKDR